MGKLESANRVFVCGLKGLVIGLIVFAAESGVISFSGGRVGKNIPTFDLS